MPSPSLISLAILKANWDAHHRDYVDNFVPLLAESVRLSKNDVVSATELQPLLERHFGLRLPIHVIRSALGRLKRLGIIKPHRGALIRDPEAIAKLRFHELQQRALEMYEAVVAKLRTFCHERYEVQWAPKDAEAALHSYLESDHIAVVEASLDANILPPSHAPPSSASFLVGTFVRELQQQHSPEFDYIVHIVTGNMLANAVFLPDPFQAGRRFRNTDVYFDTSLLVHAMGYSGKTRQAPASELIELLYSLGARIRCFRHTYDEIIGALDACAHQLAMGGSQLAFGPIIPTVEYFHSAGLTSSDVEYLATKLDSTLESIRVKVVDKPTYEPSLVMDEKSFRAALEKRINYSNPQALDRDVDSISAIHRLRGGEHFYIPEECRALFVTANRTLSRTAAEFYYTEAPPTAIAPCVTDFALTNIAWLKSPLRAPDLPRKRLIADFFAATQPSDALLRRYVAEIRKLSSENRITEEEVFLLRYSLEAKSGLMDATFGEEDVFTIGTVAEILAQVKTGMTAATLQELQTTRGQLADLRQQEEDRRLRLTLRSQRAARVTSRFSGALLILLLAAAALATSPILRQAAESPLMSFFLFPLSLLAVSFSIANYIWGTTVKSLVTKFELVLQPRIERILIRLTQ